MVRRGPVLALALLALLGAASATVFFEEKFEDGACAATAQYQRTPVAWQAQP